jgi:hypothetical protein
MKRLILFFLLVSAQSVFAQSGDLLPGGPLGNSSDMGETAGNTASGVNKMTPNQEFEQEQEEIREEEMLENRYDVPDEKEDKEFNENGTQNP